jgi:hypothetical protein
MTEGAAVGQPCADRQIGVEVTYAILFVWTLSLGMRELALKELSSPADRAIRIAADDENRRAWGHDIASPSADFIGQRFVDAGIDVVKCLCVVRKLCLRCTKQHDRK